MVWHWDSFLSQGKQKHKRWKWRSHAEENDGALRVGPSFESQTILVTCCLAVNSRVFCKLLYRQSCDDGSKNDWQQDRNWGNLWVPVPPVHRQVRVKSEVDCFFSMNSLQEVHFLAILSADSYLVLNFLKNIFPIEPLLKTFLWKSLYIYTNCLSSRLNELRWSLIF